MQKHCFSFLFVIVGWISGRRRGMGGKGIYDSWFSASNFLATGAMGQIDFILLVFACIFIRLSNEKSHRCIRTLDYTHPNFYTPQYGRYVF